MPTKPAKDANIASAAKTPYLGADVGRNTDKLRVGCERCQVLHGLDQGRRGDATLIAVVLREVPVQGLMGDNTETDPTEKHRSPLGHLPVKESGLVGIQNVW